MASRDRLDVAEADDAASTRLALAASELREEVISLAIEIAKTAAPSNDEGRRSALVAAKMDAYGYDGVTVDSIGDVVGLLPGVCDGSKLLLAAHLDTVFPLDVPLTIERSGDRVHGPGIGDNSLGVAAVVTLPKLLSMAGLSPGASLLATGNVGEEGLGNLRGIRAVLDARDDVGAVIAVEGHNLGRVTNVAVGSRRLEVAVTGPGGHSWGDAGKPSAIHAAGEMIAQLAHIRLGSSPKTTLNVGTIAGGFSVNTIAASTTFVIDMRSVDDNALRGLEQQVREVLRRKPRGIEIRVELIGERPAGQVAANSLIMQNAMAVLNGLGIEPLADASSTDANIPISRGIPAVCIGLTNGGNAHRVDEYIETAAIAAGLYQLAALSMQVSQDLAQSAQMN